MKKIPLIIYLILINNIFVFSNLPIPPILEGSSLDLEMIEGTLKLKTGISKTMGFNGDFLGPTIRVSNNDLIKLNIKNSLSEDSTVHWHGLHVPAEFDGGPHQIIERGTTWNPEILINQSAATLWYHPHLMGKTAEHVYNGLAGMFIIDDEYSESLNIPKDYGVNDIPIILQDRDVNRRGQFEYNPSSHDVMQGYIGNLMLTNGAVEPTLSIKSGTYRFRILNGSNSSIYRFRISDDRMFTVIASDGGFLPKSTKESSLIISPGERFEILVDFAKGEDVSFITDINGGKSFNSLIIKTTNRNGTYFKHPINFNYESIKIDEKNVINRTFNMEQSGMTGFLINGKTMNINRIDFKLLKDTKEIWTIRNVARGMMSVPHSFHVHDVQFSVLSIDGKKPGPLYSGPKDTVLLLPGQEIKIAVSFEDYTGIYMYHCHFLEHEDQGMMGQFLIE